jgi:hypothetical protein
VVRVIDDGHWVDWHDAYADPASSLSRRLAVVQHRLSNALDDAADGSIRLISVCAGQGRDVIDVVADHPRRDDVTARLIELDRHLAADARARTAAAGLATIEVIQADASTTSAYEDAVPAHVVMVCGVFGNVSDSDVRTTVFELPRLSAPGATVIWTRHRRDPDLTPAIRSWFREAGFEEVAFDTEEGRSFAVGTNRLIGAVGPFRLEHRMFSFVGDGKDACF